jgi:hypothetical protein
MDGFRPITGAAVVVCVVVVMVCFPLLCFGGGLLNFGHDVHVFNSVTFCSVFPDQFPLAVDHFAHLPNNFG